MGSKHHFTTDSCKLTQRIKNDNENVYFRVISVYSHYYYACSMLDADCHGMDVHAVLHLHRKLAGSE